MQTHTQTHCTKNSVASLKYLEKRNVLSLTLKEERVAENLILYTHTIYTYIYTCMHPPPPPPTFPHTHTRQCKIDKSRSDNRPALTPTSQPAHQPVSLPTKQSASPPASQLASPPTSQPAHQQSTSYPAHQPASHPTNQSTNQPAIQQKGSDLKGCSSFASSDISKSRLHCRVGLHGDSPLLNGWVLVQHT